MMHIHQRNRIHDAKSVCARHASWPTNSVHFMNLKIGFSFLMLNCVV